MSDLEEVKLLDLFLKGGRQFRERKEFMFSPIFPKTNLNEFRLQSQTYSLIHLSGKLVNKSKTTTLTIMAGLRELSGLFGPL